MKIQEKSSVKIDYYNRIFDRIYPNLNSGPFLELLGNNLSKDDISKWLCILLLKILLPQNLKRQEMKISEKKISRISYRFTG